jgi:hypothetical protein
MVSQFRLGRLVLLLALVLGAAAAAAAATGQASAATAAIPCDRLAQFDEDQFPDDVRVDNRFLPFVPGTQRVFEGNVDGVPHRVTFTVTDLSKEVDDVETLVIWDVDESEGEVVESELAFFAQDRSGNVWNLGEYPEEFEDGEFVGAPSTWITGEQGAEAGIHMAAQPQISSSFYLQGFAPKIDFLDCARVVQTGQSVSVPAGNFADVLVTEETNPNVPEDGIQTKHHAPGVGIVKIGFTVPGSAPEALDLVELNQLDRDELRAARREALRLDRRGFRFSEVYGETDRAERMRGRED